MLSCRRSDDALINQACQFVEQFVLCLHVAGLVERAGKHQFPMQAQAFALEQPHIDGSGIVNQRQFALRRQDVDQLFKMPVGLRQADDMADWR